LSTTRPKEAMLIIDWESKVALFQLAYSDNTEKLLFFSILEFKICEKISLISFKKITEDFLKCYFFIALLYHYHMSSI